MTELNGSDSKAVASVNCSSHWFDERKGITAVGWYEQGCGSSTPIGPRTSAR
jgi:hypothetical protein